MGGTSTWILSINKLSKNIHSLRNGNKKKSQNWVLGGYKLNVNKRSSSLCGYWEFEIRFIKATEKLNFTLISFSLMLLFY